MKKHVYYFDYLRAMAAIGVIYMHIAANPLRGAITTDWHIINIFTSFSFIAVPLFFMMSGYLLLSNEKTLNTSVLLKKRLPHLIVPLITYTIVAIIWKLFKADNLSIGTFATELISSLDSPAWVHFWYMYTLISLYLISPLLYGGINSLDKKGHIIVLCIIAFPSLRTILQIFLPPSADALMNIDIFTELTLFSGHLCTFLLGYYLGNIKKKIPNIILIAVAVITLVIIVRGTHWLTVKNGAFDQSFQKQASGFEIILASCIFLLFKQLCNKESKILRYIPLIPLSLPIYLIHNILISMFNHIGIMTKLTTFSNTLIFTVIILVASYLFAKTVASIKPLCFIFTGMSYDSACKSCNWIYTFKKKTEIKQTSTIEKNG